MTLYEKITTLYPELQNEILIHVGIVLQNDLNNQGDYIAKWEHPTLQRPTNEQLAEIN